MSPSLRRGVEAKKSPARVLREMETGPRWGDLSTAALSLLYGPLHHHIEAVNPSSNWHSAADMWFLSSNFTTGLDSAQLTLIMARNALIADLGSGVKFRERRIVTRYVSGLAKHMRRATCSWCSSDVMRMWVYSNIWKACFCMWVGSVWFNADQLLDSSWWYFFWPIHPVRPVCFVPGQDFCCSLWPFAQNNMSCVCKVHVHVGGWICMYVFFLNFYLSREGFL